MGWDLSARKSQGRRSTMPKMSNPELPQPDSDDSSSVLNVFKILGAFF